MTEGTSYRGLFIAVVLFLLVPLALVEYVPMVDLPGHLARIHILRNYDQEPQFREVYALTGKLIPNLAIDLIIVPLTHIMSLYQAARVFVALGMLVFALGCWTLSYSVYGRITPLAVLALFVQYNSTFFYGFVSFQLGVGLMLLTLGLWYRWRAQWSAGRVAVLLVLGVLIYVSHLGGYMYLGIGLGWLTLRTWLREKRIFAGSLVGLLPLIPPLLIYVSVGTVRGQVNEIAFSSLPQKALHAAMLLIGYDRYVDAAVAGLLVVAGGAALRYGKFRFQPEMGSLGIVFFISFLALPWLLLTGSDADTRMMLGAGVFLLLGFTCEIQPATGKLIYGIALAALVARVAFCGWVWTQQSEFIAGHVAFLDGIPEKARVFPVMRFSEDQKANKFERVLTHIPDLATVSRQAIVSTVFAVPGQHSLVLRTPRWVPNTIAVPALGTFDWDRVAREYDTIWQYGRDPALLAILDKRFRQIGQHGDARLYQTR